MFALCRFAVLQPLVRDSALAQTNADGRRMIGKIVPPQQSHQIVFCISHARAHRPISVWPRHSRRLSIFHHYYSTSPLRTQQNFYFVAFAHGANISPSPYTVQVLGIQCGHPLSSFVPPYHSKAILQNAFVRLCHAHFAIAPGHYTKCIIPALCSEP